MKSINNLKKILFIIEGKFPLIGTFLIKALRELRFFFYKIIFLFNKSKINTGNIFQVYWIDPRKIYYCYDKKFNVLTDRGTVVDGDWDLSTKRFEDTETYKGMRERFVGNKKWEQTQFYNDVLDKINCGKSMWHCTDKEQWDFRLKRIDALYSDIKENGYHVQGDQKNNSFDTYNGRADRRYQKIDEILISIGRNGQLFFNDGSHRLAMAKILKLSKIPVMVLVRHKKWVDFKKKIMSYAKLQNGKLYQPAYYFDLLNIPFSYGPKRFELIRDNISSLNGKVLDIGANLGYFCHKLEGLGFDCLAVEINPQDVYFMKKLKSFNNDNFCVTQESILSYKKDEILKFNIVLALNIFHHFLKREDTYEKLKNLLRRIDSKEMFFETHNPEEAQMQGAYKNYNSEDFVKFIIENTSFKQSSLIFSFDDGRKLYKLF